MKRTLQKFTIIFNLYNNTILKKISLIIIFYSSMSINLKKLESYT